MEYGHMIQTAQMKDDPLVRMQVSLFLQLFSNWNKLHSHWISSKLFFLEIQWGSVLPKDQNLNWTNVTKHEYFVLQYVAAFAVSSTASNLHRIGKPFNPLLGETYELVR
jgi:hypothetical protein